MSLPPPSADRWASLEALVDVALSLSRDERRRFLDDPATGDAALRAELAQLVAECEQSGALLERPAAERFASLWSDDGDLGSLQAAIADRYTIQQQLGRGGMGTVFRAHDLRHDRPIALKVLHDALSAAVGEQRFRREIRIAARLQHPHILPVFDSGDAAGRLWFTMPLVDGETLRDRLVREPQLPLADAVRIASEMAAALEYAHRQGVIHRDVKPENVLLTAGAGDALLADFGIARSLKSPSVTPPNGTSSTLTAAGVSIGTPAYMSPEQASGDADVDGRSDVYSLGAVLYEMLAGAPVYSAVNARALMARHALDPIPSVCVVRPGVPASVDAAIQRALAKTPADRFASAGAFAEALGAFDLAPATHPAQLRDAAPAAAPPWRRPRAVALAAVVLVASTAAVWGARRASTASEPKGLPGAVVGQQLTFSGWARQPAFSPDGRQVLYVERQCDDSDGTCVWALTVRDVGSDQSAVLVKAEIIVRPTWSPDGSWIAFGMQVGDEGGTYVLPRLGGAPARKVGVFGLPSFSADGDTLSVVQMSADRKGLAMRRVRPATGAPIDSGTLSLPLSWIVNFEQSPDQRWIAASGSGPCGSCVLLVTRDGRLTDSLLLEPLARVRWDPRGDALYAVVEATGLNGWMIRATLDPKLGKFGRQIDTLFSVPTVGAGQFDIAPDGRSLVYGGGSTTTTLWALDLADSTFAPRSLHKTTSFLGGAVLSSDGELVAYTTTDRLGENVYVQSFQGGDMRPVTQEQASTGAYFPHGWHRGSHRIFYEAWTGREKGQVFSQDVLEGARRRAPHYVPGTTAHPLADGGLATYGPGRTLTFYGASGNRTDSLELPDSLGTIVIPFGEDVEGTGFLLTAGSISTINSMRVIRIDRGTKRITVLGVLPNAGTSPTRVLNGTAAGAMFATWPRGARTGKPTLWKVTAGRPNTELRELPIECDEQTLASSDNGMRFICTGSSERPDIFLLEQFDRYRR